MAYGIDFRTVNGHDASPGDGDYQGNVILKRGYAIAFMDGLEHGAEPAGLSKFYDPTLRGYRLAAFVSEVRVTVSNGLGSDLRAVLEGNAYNEDYIRCEVTLTGNEFRAFILHGFQHFEFGPKDTYRDAYFQNFVNFKPTPDGKQEVWFSESGWAGLVPFIPDGSRSGYFTYTVRPNHGSNLSSLTKVDSLRLFGVYNRAYVARELVLIIRMSGGIPKAELFMYGIVFDSESDDLNDVGRVWDSFKLDMIARLGRGQVRSGRDYRLNGFATFVVACKLEPDLYMYSKAGSHFEAVPLFRAVKDDLRKYLVLRTVAGRWLTSETYAAVWSGYYSVFDGLRTLLHPVVKSYMGYSPEELTDEDGYYENLGQSEEILHTAIIICAGFRGFNNGEPTGRSFAQVKLDGKERRGIEGLRLSPMLENITGYVKKNWLGHGPQRRIKPRAEKIWTDFCDLRGVPFTSIANVLIDIGKVRGLPFELALHNNLSRTFKNKDVPYSEAADDVLSDTLGRVIARIFRRGSRLGGSGWTIKPDNNEGRFQVFESMRNDVTLASIITDMNETQYNECYRACMKMVVTLKKLAKVRDADMKGKQRFKEYTDRAPIGSSLPWHPPTVLLVKKISAKSIADLTPEKLENLENAMKMNGGKVVGLMDIINQF